MHQQVHQDPASDSLKDQEPPGFPLSGKGRARILREGLPLPVLETWAMHVSVLLVGGTGLVYAWMAYLATPVDPFSVVRHPWQPVVQHLHVLVVPLLVFATGLIWRRHVWSSWRLGIRSRRRSGVSLALSLFPMVASGYLIQVSVSDSWRNAWVWIHLATSAIWLVGYLVHQFLVTKRP